MKYHLYDFDKTIYDGDSSVDFFKYCQKKFKIINLKYIYNLIKKFIHYKTKRISLTQFKEYIFSYLNKIENVDTVVEDFWLLHSNKIKDFYLEKNHSKDIIISASPEFLLKPICDKLKVKDLIASDVDKKTGRFLKNNNMGYEKVVRFNEKYSDAVIESMYSDSFNDKPLLDLAKKSYLVKKNKIYDYKTYKPNIIKRLWNASWNIYHKNEEIWNYLIVGFLTTIVSIGSYALFARIMKISYIYSNVFSWVAAVLFAYFANRIFVFHSNENNKIKEFLKFTTSRLATLLIDTLCMILLIEICKINDMISKIIVQFIIVILNYVLSKLLVFKPNKKE